MPENLSIGEQIIKTGGFPRTAQEIYNSPAVSGGTSIFDAPKSSNDKTSLSTVNPILPSKVDISGRYPKQILGADNEDLFAQGQSTGEKWWNAGKKMIGITGATFLENTVGLLDGLGEWVSTGNISSLWNNSVNTSLNEWTQGLENSSPNYYSAKERNAKFLSSDNLLTANFWADKVMKNLGFSVGSIGGGLAWGAILKGIGLTGAIAKAGSNMEQFAAGLETAVQNAPKAERTFSALKYIEDASKSIVGATGSALTKADRAIVAGLGTYGEASIEALNNYTQFKNDRIRDFELKNGYKPSGSELDEIEQQAAHVGNWSMGLNMALLSATNYIQLPKILNMSGKAEKAIINGVETQPLKQVGEKIVSALPEKGFAKRLYQAKNLAGLLFNPAEGFEEGAQNVIQEGTQDFFNKKYNKQDATFGSSLGYATKETLTSKNGLEQILIGALSGGLQTSGFHSFGRTGNIKERGFTGYGGERAKITEDAINTLNKSKFSQVLRENVDAFNRAQTLQSQREAALRQGDILEAKDLERDYQFNYLYPRIKYGKFDFVQEDINNYRNAAATEAGFKELQRQGIANDTDTKEDFLKRLTNFEEHAKAVKKSYEYLNNKYGSNKEFTPKVVDRLAYNLSKIQNYDDRIKELSSELLKKGISIQEILDEIHKGSPKKETVKNALSQIDELNDVSSIKDDLKQQLQDVTELSLRRKQYTSNYNNIVKTPKNYATLDTDFENEKEATIRQRDDEGKSKSFTAEVGKEYSISDDGIFRDGNTLTFNPKLIILNNTLDGQLHVKLPNGKETFVTPSELKDYKISQTDNYSPELEKEVESAVTSVLESDKFKELFKLLPENPTFKDKLDFVNTLQNKPLIDAIQVAVRKKTENIRKQQEELRKKEEELRKNEELSKKFFTTIKKLQLSDNEVVDENLGDVGAMIDIVNIPYAGTEPKYEDVSEFNNAHRRHQEFLLNIFDNPKLAELYANGQLRILPVTQKTQKQLGLDGIINPQYPNTIRYVYVIDNQNGTLSYIDKEGNSIPATKSVDLNNIVFTTAREADLSFTDKETGERLESYTNKDNLSDSQIQEIKDLWAKQRELLLNAGITPENALDNTYKFTISRGLPNIVNTSAKNSVFDAKVISKSDLDNQVITVPSFKSGDKITPVPINGLGTLVNMPNGKPLFNYKGKMFFLNNRNFTDNETETITEVLIRAAKQIVETSNIDSKLIDYLNGVIRFSETPTRNSVFLDSKEFTLQIGDKGQKLSLLTLDKNRELLNTLLANVYHHVSKEKVNEMKPFTEFSLKDGKITETHHKNYQTYLLTGSQPVLTTNIIKPQEGELPIVQKYPILDIKNMDIAPIVSSQPAPEANPPKLQGILDAMNAGLGKKVQPAEGKKADIERRIQEELEATKLNNSLSEFELENTPDLKTGSTSKRFKIKKDGKEVGIVSLNINENGNVRIAYMEINPSNRRKGLAENFYKDLNKALQKNKQGVLYSDKVFLDELSEWERMKKRGELRKWILDGKELSKDEINTLKKNIDKVIELEDSGRLVTEEAEDLQEVLPAQKMWEKLVEKGFAEKLEDGTYRFKYDAELAALQPNKTEDVANSMNSILKKGFGKGNFNEPQHRLIYPFKFSGNKAEEIAEIKRMLPGVHIEYVENLIDAVGGMKAWGYALPKLIAVYEGAPFGVGYHEAFEQVFNWILSPKEQLELYKEFTQRTGSFRTYNGEYKTFASADFKEAKEQMADEFAEFKATGKIPYAKKNTSNFFKRLWNLLKSLFTTKGKLESVFNNLNNGYYANSQIRTQTSEQQYKAVVNTPEALFQDTISGMTAELFMKKWNDDTSLILQLEDNAEESTKPLFDQLYEGLNRFYTQEGDNTLDAYYGKLAEQNPEQLDNLLKEYAKVQDYWNKVSNQWDNYMQDLKKFLKVFDIAFTIDENGDMQLSSELQDEYEKLGGADSYTSESKMHLNAKNSASRAVKLLFATIADSNFVEAVTKNQIGEITRKYTGELATTRAENQMKLPNLAPYAKLFNYTLHNSVNTNGITKILDKLKGIVTNKKIKQNANLQRLLNRLNFNGTFESLPKETVKLLLKLENALSKNKPQFFRQYITTKEGIINQKSYLSSTSEQIIDGWINNIKSSNFTIVENNKIKFKPSVISSNKFTFLSNIGINFTPAEYELLPQSVKSEFDENVAKIIAEVKGYTSRFLPINTTRQNIGFSSRLETLAEIYTEYVEGDTSESQHANLDGEPYPNFILPNYVSFILNDTDAKTRDEFIRLNPQYRDIYMGSSHLLNNVLYDKEGKRTNKKIKVSLTEGIYDGFDNKAAHHNMTFSQRLVNEINNNLNGIYAALIPADAKTPWGLDMGNVVAKTAYFKREPESINDFIDAMWEAMIAEVNLAKDFPNRSFITQLNATNKETGRQVGEELRFFKGILSPRLVARIQEKLIDEGMQLNDEQLTAFKESFKSDLLTYVNKKAADTITNLRGYQLVESRNGKNTLFGIDKNFLKSIYGNKDRYILNDEQLNELFTYREMNYIYNNIELHRFLFNDPAQYKDETKRIKSFLSGREYAHSEENSGLNEALNVINNPNAIPSDWGYKQHKDQFNALTIKSVKTYNKDYESYRNNDIADAQSWALGNTYYEMLWKSGGRTSSKQDELHQWLMAWERQKLLEKGVISEDNYSKQLQKADIKILKSRIPEANMPVLKPIISGVSDNGVQYLYKTSTAPLYLYFVEGTPMEKTYIKAMKNNVEFIAMDSAHKVGQTNNNTVEWESDFTKDNTVPVKYKYFGIQVETSGSKDYQTQGSQLTKLATTNLLSNGMSVDFLKENDGKSIDEKLAIWNNLTEAQKREKYPIYDLVKKHHQALIDLTLERSKKLLDKLNIKKGEFGYSIDDKTSVAEFILSEVTRRELPQNIVTGIETNADGQFKSPIEANPNYKKIKEILYSTIENNILKPKVSGGPKILLSSLGYDTLNKESVNGKDVYTTSKYKFYQEKDGKFVCQVGIPFVFGDKILRQIEKTIGKEFDTAREGYKHVLDYLNKTSEGKDLLRGIGFRIPTQGLNSVDHFEVVEFLPPQMGDVTIFPSEITTKAGSDFDVDKMNMYFKNWYINKDGYPEIIPFLGTDEKAKDKLSDIELSAILAKEVKPDESALDKTKIEEDKPSFYLKSLENNYFSILGDILSLQENRDILLKPNDASGLEGVANKIDKLYGKEESSINYTNLLDSSWMLQKRQELLDSKKNVGIAAVSNTNLAVNQNTFFVIYPTDNYNLKQISRNFKWRFKHNSYGKDGVILSDRFNKNGELLSDLASQVIDGTVDVANKPWLPRLLGNSANLNVYNLLLKGGVDKYTAALFIHQPGVVEFLKRFDISVTDTQFKRKKKLYKGNVKYNMLKEQGISSKFQQQKFCDEKPELYSDSMMESFVGRDYNSLTKEEKRLQLQILDDYFMTDKQSSQSFSVVQTYNWDTTRFTNPESVTQKQLDLQNGFGISNIQGIGELLKNTQLATIVKSVLSASEGINSAFESHRGNSAAILGKIGLNMRTQFFSKDDRVKYSQKAEQSMIDYILQNNAEFKGQPLGKWIGTTLLSGNSIAHWVKEMQKIPGLESNLFLQNIEAVIDVRDGYNSYIKMKEPDFDSFTSDRWTASLRELRDNFSTVKLGNNESTVSNIYNHMLISQILQYGTGKVKNSFLHIIPAEDFAAIATPAISGNKSNLDTWLSEGLFYRNNYNNSDLVPEAHKEWIISTDNDGNEIESFEVPKFTSQKFNEKLANKGYQVDLLRLKSFGASNNPFVKISNIEHDENGNVLSRSVTLYKRVDLSENEPILIDNNQNVLYKKVNKLGNDNLKEYISTISQLNENEKVRETPDDIIIKTLSESGIKYSSQPLTELVSPDEFEENSLSLQETLDIKKDCK